MRYEMVREIFNQCSNNQMRDVSVSDIEADDLDEVVSKFLTGKNVEMEKSVSPDGDIIYDIVADGLRQRVSFSEY
ncbi:MAG: hypothetical protein ACOYIK_10390 [Coriobacteriales bacterium]|jgi:hypothetical protein